MSCVLRVVGQKLNIEDILKIDSNPETYWKKGELRIKSSPEKKKHLCSGANYCISEAEFNEFDEQKNDAIRYLKENKEKVKAIQKIDGIESMFLDFGIEKRNVFMQSNFFPPELIQLAGDLGLGIELSQYSTCDDEN